jgi:NCS1 family nucleobase:cation symporter-1
MTAHLFNPKANNEYYRYHKGWNLQALIAYIVGIALPFPGFVATLGAKGVNKAGKDLFYLGWILSFIASFVVYIVICKFWPTQSQKLIRERGMTWEENASVWLDGRDSDTAEESITNDSKGEKGASV